MGEGLLADGVITKEQLDNALREGRTRRELLGQTIVRLGYATGDQILWALARQAGVEVVDVDTSQLDNELIRRFPESLLRMHRMLPLRRDGHTLTAATSDIGNLAGVDELRRLSNLFVTLVAAREQQILTALDRVFGKISEVREPLEPRPAAAEPAPPAAADTTGDDRSAVTVVEDLLREAITEGASDIHIEPHETIIATRFRHDGILRPGPTLPRVLFSSVITRIKILADLNIAENRLPQDGRILHQIDSQRLDMRVSVFPTIHGENVAIRVLDKSRSFGLESLGMAQRELTLFRRCIMRPYGLFLVTGPTGSGKTTTLYSALAEINGVERNIVTLEDPVEYELEGIRQTQVNPRAGLTFAVGLRALLRQDPDVMLVGEMRDLETVEIAIRSSMTGHLVFSTLHTNDAIGAIPRLMDMGVPQYLISSSVIGVLAQRLVRRLCQKCKVKITLEKAGVHRLGEIASLVTATYEAKGCDACSQTGYRGRTGIFELFIPDMMRTKTFSGDPEVMKREAIETGALAPMNQQAAAAISSGDTSVAEIIRSVFSEAVQ